MAINTTVFR